MLHCKIYRGDVQGEVRKGPDGGLDGAGLILPLLQRRIAIIEQESSETQAQFSPRISPIRVSFFLDAIASPSTRAVESESLKV